MSFPAQELVVGRFSKQNPDVEFLLHLRPTKNGGLMEVAAPGLPSEQARRLGAGLQAAYGQCSEEGGIWRVELSSAKMHGLVLPTLMGGLQLATDVWISVQAGEGQLYGESDDMAKAQAFVAQGLLQAGADVDLQVRPFPNLVQAAFLAAFSP